MKVAAYDLGIGAPGLGYTVLRLAGEDEVACGTTEKAEPSASISTSEKPPRGERTSALQ
jgi:hypothetical protein